MYFESQAWKQVLLMDPSDLDLNQRDDHPPAYDTSEITPRQCDIDMLRFEGSPDLLFGITGNPSIFGYHKKHPKMKGYQIISAEPWLIGYPQEHTSNLQSVVQKYLEFYPEPASSTNPFPQEKRLGMDLLCALLKKAGITKIVIYQYGMKTSLLQASKTLISFKRLDPSCSFHFDLATRIKPWAINGSTTTMLAYLDPKGTER